MLAVRLAPEHFYQPNKKRRSGHSGPVDTVMPQILRNASRVVPCEKIYLGGGIEHEEKSPKSGQKNAKCSS